MDTQRMKADVAAAADSAEAQQPIAQDQLPHRTDGDDAAHAAARRAADAEAVSHAERRPSHAALEPQHPDAPPRA